MEKEIRETNRRLEEALAELKMAHDRIIQQERLRALGQIASGIAHDLNNALAPILGFAELLLMRPENLDDKEKAKYYLEMISTAAKDAANVVARLKEFYRQREEGEIWLPVNLNQIVDQVISITQPKWKDQALASGIRIRIETNLQEVPLVAGNEAELRQALINLVFNAVDAMPEGGTIRLRTGVHEQKPAAISRGGQESGEKIHKGSNGASQPPVFIEVSDTGTGMSEEVRQRCMDPFFTTKGERGTGLGLSIVYGIIQRHEGKIDIESESGKGTTFRIGLPLWTGRKAETRKKQSEGMSRSLRVLVIDDEPLVREVVTEYLTGDGHTVETATNGREGLEKFQAGWFDLVVTDRAMPEMSGDQLAATIKQIAPDKPIVLLTGFGEMMQTAGEKPAGVGYIVSKPVTLAALREAVAKAVKGVRGQRPGAGK